MPNALLKTYSLKSNKPLSEVERLWAEAKHIADEKFSDKENNPGYYVIHKCNY